MSRIGRKRNRQGGFTLIELLIVCVIVGLLMCGTVPAFRDAFRSASLRRAAGDVRATLQYARACAISEEWGFIVRFDKDANRYRLVRVSHPLDPGSGANDDTRSERRLPRDVVIEETTFPMTAEGFVATFYPDGTAEAGEIVLKTSNAAKHETAMVRISGDTGRVALGGAE
jgi:prepilin-type N-terminal cleavage/methylation domain-containing protein